MEAGIGVIQATSCSAENWLFGVGSVITGVEDTRPGFQGEGGAGGRGRDFKEKEVLEAHRWSFGLKSGGSGIRSGFMLLQRNKLVGEAWKCFSSAAIKDSPVDVRDPAKGIDNGGTVETSGEGPLLKLEDLNWDHSFVRELPRDPRTDIMPREV